MPKKSRKLMVHLVPLQMDPDFFWSAPEIWSKVAKSWLTGFRSIPCLASLYPDDMGQNAPYKLMEYAEYEMETHTEDDYRNRILITNYDWVSEMLARADGKVSHYRAMMQRLPAPYLNAFDTIYSTRKPSSDMIEDMARLDGCTFYLLDHLWQGSLISVLEECDWSQFTVVLHDGAYNKWEKFFDRYFYEMVTGNSNGYLTGLRREVTSQTTALLMRHFQLKFINVRRLMESDAVRYNIALFQDPDHPTREELTESLLQYMGTFYQRIALGLDERRYRYYFDEVT